MSISPAKADNKDDHCDENEEDENQNCVCCCTQKTLYLVVIPILATSCALFMCISTGTPFATANTSPPTEMTLFSTCACLSYSSVAAGSCPAFANLVAADAAFTIMACVFVGFAALLTLLRPSVARLNQDGWPRYVIFALLCCTIFCTFLSWIFAFALYDSPQCGASLSASPTAAAGAQGPLAFVAFVVAIVALVAELYDDDVRAGVGSVFARCCSCNSTPNEHQNVNSGAMQDVQQQIQQLQAQLAAQQQQLFQQQQQLLQQQPQQPGIAPNINPASSDASIQQQIQLLQAQIVVRQQQQQLQQQQLQQQQQTQQQQQGYATLPASNNNDGIFPVMVDANYNQQQTQSANSTTINSGPTTTNTTTTTTTNNKPKQKDDDVSCLVILHYVTSILRCLL